MHSPAGLYFHFSSGATALLAVTLTFLFLSGTTNGALRCIEDGTGSYSSAASNRVQQSVKPNGGNGGGGRDWMMMIFLLLFFSAASLVQPTTEREGILKELVQR